MTPGRARMAVPLPLPGSYRAVSLETRCSQAQRRRMLQPVPLATAKAEQLEKPDPWTIDVVPQPPPPGPLAIVPYGNGPPLLNAAIAPPPIRPSMTSSVPPHWVEAAMRTGSRQRPQFAEPYRVTTAFMSGPLAIVPYVAPPPSGTPTVVEPAVRPSRMPSVVEPAGRPSPHTPPIGPHTLAVEPPPCVPTQPNFPPPPELYLPAEAKKRPIVVQAKKRPAPRPHGSVAEEKQRPAVADCSSHFGVVCRPGKTHSLGTLPSFGQGQSTTAFSDSFLK